MKDILYKNPMKSTYIFFTCTDEWRKPSSSLSAFYTVHSSGGVRLCILELRSLLEQFYILYMRDEHGILVEWLLTGGNPLPLTEICASATFSATDFTWAVLWKNLVLRLLKSATNDLGYDEPKQRVKQKVYSYREFIHLLNSLYFPKETFFEHNSGIIQNDHGICEPKKIETTSCKGGLGTRKSEVIFFVV
jgi:hypothetical protein